MTRTDGTGVVISGVGQSAVGRLLDQTPLQLTLDAVTAALDDAGLTLADVDGLGSSVREGAEVIPGFCGPSVVDVQAALGLSTSWQLSEHFSLYHAVAAIRSGVARHILLFRTITEGRAAKRGGRAGMGSTWPSAAGEFAYSFSLGAMSAANMYGLYAQRHMARHGIKREQLGWLAVTQRAHAALNPRAVYRDPITIDDYLAARMISSPLCLFDCDVPVDASTAIVVSAADAQADLRHPVRIESVAYSNAGRVLWDVSDIVDDVARNGGYDCARQMWSRTTLVPGDVDVAELYDGMSYLAMLWLEALGLCGQGESGDFVDGGTRISLGGDLPVNTWGGQLSGGRLHAGFGHTVEAVRQLRGEAGERQIENAEVAVTTAGPPLLGTCVLLTRS